jgi:hypothetical protein
VVRDTPFKQGRPKPALPLPAVEQTPESKLFLSQSSQWKVLKTLHQTYHLGVHKTVSMAGQLFEGIKLRDTLQDIIKGCEIIL